MTAAAPGQRRAFVLPVVLMLILVASLMIDRKSVV